MNRATSDQWAEGERRDREARARRAPSVVAVDVSAAQVSVTVEGPDTVEGRSAAHTLARQTARESAPFPVGMAASAADLHPSEPGRVVRVLTYRSAL